MMKTNFIPFYFPQLYPIPENDAWWGKGYTDWDRVRTSVPRSDTHFQPRVPLNGNYYDQGRKKTQEWQINLALDHGICGFNFYHYWFDGKLLLEKPLHHFRTIDHPLTYCITWANETWTKRWEGRLNEILIAQHHRPDTAEWEKHFNYLQGFFEDERYIRIDHKPVFCIYRPDIIRDVSRFIDFFQEKAIQSGFPGIYFMALKAYEPKDSRIYSRFDGIMRFQPRDIFGRISGKSRVKKKVEASLRGLPERFQILLSALDLKFQKGRIYDYDLFWEQLIDTARQDLSSAVPVYQSVPVDWDNTPRYREKSHYFMNYSPEKFRHYLTRLLDVFSQAGRPENYIFVNAWNEWSEGAYLEPDERDRFKNLETLKRLRCYGG